MKRQTGTSAGVGRPFLACWSPDGSALPTPRVEEGAWSSGADGDPATETILIVDDDAAGRTLLEEILTGAGYQVRQAAGGEVALTQAATDPPDVILLDLLMPGMDGLEVCRRLKEDSATSAVPVIVVTALGQVAAKEASLTTGADDFVTKPVRPDDLRARVQAMLKVRRIRQEIDRTLAYLHELAAARDAQEGLVLLASLQPRDQLLDGLGLVAGHLVVGNEAEAGGGGGHQEAFTRD